MAETSRLEELQRRVHRDPASISFAGLAEEYRRLGLFQEAIDTCRAGLLRHPSYASARVTLGRALLEIGEYDDATVELEQVLRVAPENLAAIRALAEIHRRRGEMPESIEQYVLPTLPTLPIQPTVPTDPIAPTPPVEAAQADIAPIAPAMATPVASTPIPVSAFEPSPEVPVAVQSTVVETYTPPPSLAVLEEFLESIERARRDISLQAGR
jgi:hypothetical protein